MTQSPSAKRGCSRACSIRGNVSLNSVTVTFGALPSGKVACCESVVEASVVSPGRVV